MKANAKIGKGRCGTRKAWQPQARAPSSSHRRTPRCSGHRPHLPAARLRAGSPSRFDACATRLFRRVRHECPRADGAPSRIVVRMPRRPSRPGQGGCRRTRTDAAPVRDGPGPGVRSSPGSWRRFRTGRAGSRAWPDAPPPDASPRRPRSAGYGSGTHARPLRRGRSSSR